MTAQPHPTTAAATDTTKPARDEAPIDAAALVRDADTMSDAEVTHIFAGLAAHAALDPDTYPYFPKIGRAFLRDLGTLVAEHQARKEQARTEQARRTAASAAESAKLAAATAPTIPVRRRTTIEMAIPTPSSAPDFYTGDPAHVDAYLVGDIIDLLQALALKIDPLDDDGEGYADMYRLRATVHRYTALLEDALAVHNEEGVAGACRREMAEQDEMDARRAANEAERKRDAGDTAAAPSAPAAAHAVRAS